MYSFTIKFLGCSSYYSVNNVCNSPCSSSEHTDHEMWVKLMTSENDKSHGSLFLRIGAIAFGLGTLIYAGLEFLTFFEMPKSCSEWSILLGVNPILYMIFVFMQVQICKFLTCYLHLRLCYSVLSLPPNRIVYLCEG